MLRPSDLNLDHAYELERLLKPLSNEPGFVGTTVVGYDGVVAFSDSQDHAEAIKLGLTGLRLFEHARDAIRGKVIFEVLEHLILGSSTQYLLITNFGSGLLIIVIDRTVGFQFERFLDLNWANENL